MIQAVLAGIVMIGVLVVIHEFGHFIVAKAFRVGVPVFSVGMGPRLFGIRFRGTDYRVSMLPIGGYVQMSGADPFGEEDADAMVSPEEDFMRKPVWQRLLVMFAGPVANLILPFVLFTAVLMLGEPQPDGSIGTIMPDTPAERAGLREGDVIQSVGGHPVEVWADLVLTLDDLSHQGAIDLVVQRGDAQHTVTLPEGTVRYTIDGLIDMERVGMWSNRLSTRVGVDDKASPAGVAGLRTGDAILSVNGVPVVDLRALQAALREGSEMKVAFLRIEEGQPEPVRHTTTLVADPAWAPRPEDQVTDRWGLTPAMLYVGGVAPESPALRHGVRPEDRVWSVDGTVIRAWSELVDLVGATAANHQPGAEPRTLDLVVVREGELVHLTFAPRMEREVVRGEVRFRPIMGIEQYPDSFTQGPRIKKYYAFAAAVPRATEEGMMVFKHTIRVLGNLFTNKLKPSESVGGPIEIFRMASEGAKRGIFAYARLIGTISFSLGIINLLPVPVLDGGQILFYSIEGIRGRPLSLEIREKVQMVGVLALVAIMLMVTVMDVSRWLGS